MLKGFIPKYISNDTFIAFYEFLRKLGKALHGAYKRNEGDFRKALNDRQALIRLKERTARTSGYIEDQFNYLDLRYGKYSVGYCGCEVIALYNALRSLKKLGTLEFKELLVEFERDGIVLSGKFGSSPKAIADYLKKRGYRIETTTHIEEFEAVAGRSKTLILVYYNDGRDITKMVHTINISKENDYRGEEAYVAHNAYTGGRASLPQRNISELIASLAKGHAKGIYMIGIN